MNQQKLIIFGVAAGVGAILTIYAIARQHGVSIAELNKGTPYEGFGVVGTLGNATNQALGGLPERIGGWIGGKLADLRGL